MKFASFNVNSVRLRLHQLDALIDTHQPDVIGLQETKVVDADFPVEAFEERGYHSVYYGQKTHYGVALLSREPVESVRYGFPGAADDAQRRLIGVRLRAPDGTTLHVWNGYFPQGECRDHPVKFPAKQRFYTELLQLLQTAHAPDEPLLVMGDFNVAPLDADIGIGADNVRRWLRTGKSSFLPEEREWLHRLSDWGLDDSYRVLYPDRDDLFSWFDYRSRGFERDPKRGIRIDHILCTKSLTARLGDAGIDYAIRAMPKPSDHCPVWASFSFDR